MAAENGSDEVFLLVAPAPAMIVIHYHNGQRRGSLINLPKTRIADVVCFVNSFQGDVRQLKLDKGYKFFFE